MRRSLPPIVLALAAVLAILPASPAGAAPYAVEITNPQADDGVALVRGRVRVVAEVSGLGGASDVAYVLTEPGQPWDQPGATSMGQLEAGGPWEAALDTTGIPNGTYRLRVRAWGGSAGDYDPNDEETYAAAVLALDISNAPPAPEGLEVQGGAGRAFAAWDEVATADRSDFAGYEVYVASKAGSGCPGFGDAYTLRTTTFATNHAEEGLAAGRYCFRIRALRSSPLTGTVGSKVSGAQEASVAKGDALGSGGDPNDPDGQYSPGLPYGPATEVTPIAGGPVAGGPLEAGTDEGRNGWLFMAGGLVLAILALLLRRYVKTAPEG